MSNKNGEIPELDANGLRSFALITGALIILLFALAIPWLLGLKLPVWPWIAGLVLVVWGILAPITLRPVYRLWMRFGLLMSRITTPLILGLVFFIIFTPVAAFMKLRGRDPLRLQSDNDTNSYRVKSTVASRRKMEKPF